MFALEILDNGANLVATFFAVDIVYPKVAPKKSRSRNSQQFAVARTYRRHHSYNGKPSNSYSGLGDASSLR